MTTYRRLELDEDDADETFVERLSCLEDIFRCDACRTTWIDPKPGPISLCLAEPEGGCAALRPGVLWTDALPAFVVSEELAAAAAARWPGAFHIDAVSVDAVDGDPPAAGADGGPWVALWPLGCSLVADVGAGGPERCQGCGRLAGEHEMAWDDRWPIHLPGGAAGAPVERVGGWRYTLFATDEWLRFLRDVGAHSVRFVPTPSVL